MPQICQHEGCEKSASFNLPGGSPRFCLNHKDERMINVKPKKCQHEDCMINASFALPGQKARFCSSHSEYGMINKVSKI